MYIKSSGIVSAVIEVTADKIGEMLVETADGIREHSYEEIAQQALLAYINTLIDEGPSKDRIDAVGAAIYRQLHDQKATQWVDLPVIEKSFWEDIARAAITAGDIGLKCKLENK